MPFIVSTSASLTQFAKDLQNVENHTHYLKVQYQGKNVSYEIVPKEKYFFERIIQFFIRLFDSSYNFNQAFPCLIEALQKVTPATNHEKSSLKQAVVSLNNIVTYINSKRFFGRIDLTPLEETAKKIEEFRFEKMRLPITDVHQPVIASPSKELMPSVSPESLPSTVADPTELVADSPIFTEAQMKQALEEWIKEPDTQDWENRREATERIWACFRSEDPVLNLEGLHLSTLPEALGQLTFLQYLDLGSNHLSHLPKEIAQLVSLKNLNLRCNHLSSLPDEMAHLTSLTNLNLSDNSFKDLPAVLGNLSALTDLDLSENLLEEIPEVITGLTSLQVLYLNDNWLENVPAAIGALTALEVLYLGNNRIRSLPPEIGHLVALKKFDLGYNQLEDLPREMEKLEVLKELDLRHNLLGSLPLVITKLTALTDLDVSENLLEQLPEEVGELKLLKNFYARANAICNLPERIGELTSLEYINLSENHIRDLPETMGNLKALMDLDLSYNPLALESIPSVIRDLPHLTITIMPHE